MNFAGAAMRCGLLLGLNGLLTGVCAAQVGQHFFPKRPPGVTLHHDVGVLVDYGMGNDTGDLSIRRSDGASVEYYLAYPQRIDGRVYRCARPPAADGKIDYSVCPSWPRNVEPGKTRVRLTYWWMDYPGTHLRIRVSDPMVRDP